MNKALRKISRSIFAVFLISGCATTTPSVELPIQKREVSTFDNITKDVARFNKTYGEENVLIVLDIDNTVLTSSVDLGGDIWYQWQRGKLSIKPSQEQKVDCLFEDSIGLLYELGTMQLTEKTVPVVISGWQSEGNTVMALTSRAPKYRAATERELHNKGIDFEASALAPSGSGAPVYREVEGRELSYMKGIMMTSGMNKGVMIDYILDKTGRSFDAIVFVDDSKKNIDNVYNAFIDRKDIDTNIYHYVKIEADREDKFGSVLTQEQADKMSSDWRELNKTLNAIFPQRERSEGCLSKN